MGGRGGGEGGGDNEGGRRDRKREGGGGGVGVATGRGRGFEEWAWPARRESVVGRGQGGGVAKEGAWPMSGQCPGPSARPAPCFLWDLKSSMDFIPLLL